MQNVFFFGNGHADGGAHMADVLGGKGANLAEMSNLGIPVPPGFTISAAMCGAYLVERTLPDDLRTEVEEMMGRLESVTGKRFGDPDDPLLVSVRSGGKFSMPGMMDTILNLGLNDTTVLGLAERSHNERFAYDSFRRLLHMYGDVVFGVKGQDGRDDFEHALSEAKLAAGVLTDAGLAADSLRALAVTFKDIIARTAERPFPQDPWDQLWGAIEAVFGSWQTRRAIDYRRIHGIPHDLGTAVNIQAMVFGNMGEDCGTGVAFTRNPSTGEPHIFGEFLSNAQGEDVVAGTRDPEPIDAMGPRLPAAFDQFQTTCATLETHFRDMQDIEFTVERGKLYMLQTRRAKRTGRAAIRAAVDMVDEGLITRNEALARVDADQLDQLLHPTVEPGDDDRPLISGLPASPGAAIGRVVFDADEAERQAADGPVVLIRAETSPDDFHGMVAAQAIVTQRGGMTSHAAVIARGMGKCCVVGCKELLINTVRCQIGDEIIEAGDWVTVDGTTGLVYRGQLPMVQPELDGYYERLMAWADEVRTLRVRANADSGPDARRARAFGAEGIGLCRTEHMFFEGERILAVREMIVAPDAKGRRGALDKLLPMQRADFEEIFAAMDGLPVTIRLLDPPLHEFLPTNPEEIAKLAKELGLEAWDLTRRIAALSEANPMLGHRGCRLGMSYPEITAMQARAIFEAACHAARNGLSPEPEIMVPLVSHVEELRRQREVIVHTAGRVFAEQGIEVPYQIGTMIELPRAALTANRIAEIADFFSFGTNDLTQTTFGLSRDDAGGFLPSYIEKGVLKWDPFRSLDTDGVGELIRLGTERGRETRPDLKVGICGEHGGDPRSISFCAQIGLDYVSCSPFRVPVARLAAAQAALEALAIEEGQRAAVHAVTFMR